MRVFSLGLLLLSVICVLGTTPRPAPAQKGEFPTPTLSVVLWSARSCYAEATWSRADCAAILHVIRKRAAKGGWTFLGMLNAYSIKNWIQSPHGKQAFELQLGTNESRSANWNRNWKNLVTYVVDVLTERATDPCPQATHWAAKYYQPRSPMRRVECDVETSNAFWADSR